MFKLIDIGIIVLSSGLFLLCYMLFLRKVKYHQINRAYLLFSLAFSSLLPFVRFTIPKQPLMPNTQIILTTVAQTSSVHFCTILYLLGTLLFFFFFLFKLMKVLRQILGKQFAEMNGLKVINHPEQKAPFSFFRYVVLDFAAFEPDELEMVLRHESAHVRQWHTVDLLFVEIMGVICWFNPFVWAYKSALKSLHEYAADEAVIRSNVPRDDYFDLILKQVRRQNRLAPVHSFSATAVKSRIRMMVATVHGRRRWMRYLFVIPMVTLFVVGNSLLASEVKMPSFMEVPIIKETVINSSSESPSDEVAVIDNNVKKVSRRAKTHPEQEENISQLDVLESQSWLSTQYGDPVEFYEEKPSSRQEVHYTVKVVGEDPQIYQVTTPRIAGYASTYEGDELKMYTYPITTPEKP